MTRLPPDLEGLFPDVSRETIGRLEAYAELLVRWSARISLVGRSTLGEMWRRHFLDSAQLEALRPAGEGHWADLGSGAGFPGLVVAIMARERAPGMRFTLVESDSRKSAFLAAVVQATGAAAAVVTGRIERIPPLAADVISARALAPLPKLLGLARRHLAPGGACLFMKGRGHGGEIERARGLWRFKCRRIPSGTDGAAAILEIGDIRRAGEDDRASED